MTIRIEPLGVAGAGLWRATLEVSVLFADGPWVIIGAQMVMLLEREQGVASGRTTRDRDAIVDVRAIVGGSRTAAGRLSGRLRAVGRHRYCGTARTLNSIL